MPTVSAGDLTKLRSQHHATTLRMVVDVPPSIWTAQVDGAHAAAVTQVRVKTVAQTMAPFTDGLIYFGTSAGANDLGESRFKQYSAPNLKVPPLPFALSDNDYVTVFNYIPPVAKIPKQQANSLVSEDNDTQYVDENTNFKPFCNFGPPAVAWADPITGVATVNFFDSSLAMATAATITTWAWVFPDGTPGTSALQGTSGAPIAVSFPIGRHYVKLTVTDSNGKTAAGFRVVWILDPASPPLATSKLEISDIEGDVDGGGYSTSVLVHDVATSAVFPDGAQVIFFADDSYNGVAGSIGGQYRYRENVVCVGYIREGSLVRNWIDQTVEFKVDGIGVLMDNLAGVASNHVLTTGVPSNWHQFYNMVPDHIALHLVQEHSTVARITDVEWTSLDFKLKYADLSEGSLRAQLSEIFASVRSRFGSNAQGMLYAEPIPNLLPLASRIQPKSIDIGLADLRGDVELGTERYEKPVSQVQFYGFAYAQDSGGNWIEKPWNALAPAVRYPTGSNQKIDGIRANSQTQANNLAGLYEGYLNNEFDEVVLHLRGNYRVCDIYPSEYITLTVPAAKNARGLDFNLTKFWIKRVSYSYTAGILLTDLVVEKDSFGAAGIVGPYPPEPPPPDNPPPPEPPPSPPPTPPPTPPPYGGWVPELYILTDLGVYHTTNFTAPTGSMPTWELLAAGLPASLQYVALEPDPYRSGTRQYLLINNTGVSPTQSELYARVSGAAWAKLVDSSDAGVLAGLINSVWGGTVSHWGGTVFQIAAMQADINQDGYIGLWATANISGLYFISETNTQVIYFYSTDYGATWHIQNKPTSYITLNGGTVRYMDIGDYAGGGYAAGQLVYATYTVPFNVGGLARSTDKGLTWAKAPNAADMNYGEVGFHTDVYQNILYVWKFGTAGTAYVKRSSDSGSTWGADLLGGVYAITSRGSIAQYRYRFHPFFTAGSGAQTLRLVLDDNRILKSTDAGATWTPYAVDPALPADTALGISMVYDLPTGLWGIDMDPSFRVVAQRTLWASEDEGATWVDKSGANAGVAPFADSIPYNAVALGILQVWN